EGVTAGWHGLPRVGHRGSPSLRRAGATHLELRRRPVRRDAVHGVGAARVVEVVDIGREHRWRGCRADAEDRQHEDGGRYADEAKRAARATTARVPCGRLWTEPSVQTLPLRQV